MNIFTLVILLIFIIFIVMGYCRGLVKSVLKMVFTGLALLLAYLLSPIICNIIVQNTTIDDSISEKIYKTIESAMEEKIKEEMTQVVEGVDEETAQQLVDTVLSNEPSRNQQIEFIQELDLPEFLKTALIDNNHTEMKQEMGVTTFYNYVSTYLSRMIVNSIVFFASFILLQLLFTITLFLVNMVLQISGLNGINRLAGALLGFGEALIIVWVLFIIIDIVVGTKMGASLMAQVEESKILTLIYDKNILAGFIENLIKNI